MFSQGFLHTEEIVFETENKPSVEKNQLLLLPVFSDLSKSQLNSSKMFQAGMFNTSWQMLQYGDPSCNRKYRILPCTWWSWSPLLGRPVGG